MAKKNALGRGLGALIEEADTSRSERYNNERNEAPLIAPTYEIDVAIIEENPFQPRKYFDEDALAELASSIKEIGMVQPITVRKTDDEKYQLIAGERRLRASKMAGLTSVPAFIREANDQSMLEMALVENIQREDLDAIEVAIGYQRLIEECDLTQENLSVRVGKKRSTIANYLRLLKLPAEIQLGIRDKRIGMGHARALVTIDDPASQLNIYRKIIDNDLSVRGVEDAVRKMGAINDKPKAADSGLPEEYAQLSKQLCGFFDTKIQLKRNNKGKGSIVIPFETDEDLERIMGIFEKMNP
jgi:ParB family transcriptional regulator, chromosome partitioning protein